jgi:hypothetical protein
MVSLLVLCNRFLWLFISYDNEHNTSVQFHDTEEPITKDHY